MNGSELLLAVAHRHRQKSVELVDLGVRMSFDPQPLIAEELQRAALYEATAADIAGLPEDEQFDKARRFMFAMWARDDRDDPAYAEEPDDYHP